MDRLFLDANVLFSAACRENAGLLELWKIRNVELVTSAYAFEEARRNLGDAEKTKCLQALVRGVSIMPESDAALPENVDLPGKDKPILRAALASNATHLITGDRRDFGRYFGKKIAGISILLPRQYLHQKRS